MPEPKRTTVQVFIETHVPSNEDLPSFCTPTCDLTCPRSSVHEQPNYVPLIMPSFPPSLLFFHAIFFPPSIPALLLPLLFCSAVAMTTAALHHSSGGDLGSCSCRESAPLTSIHNTLSANAVTEAAGVLTSVRGSSEETLLMFLFVFFFFCGGGDGSAHLSSFGTCCRHIGVTSVSPLFPQ